MIRFGRIAVAAVASLAIGAGAAGATQTPIGHLGNPDSVGKSSGTIDTALLVSTGACTGFAGDDTLVFTSLDQTSHTKIWNDAQWIETTSTISAVAGDYVLHGRLEDDHLAQRVGLQLGTGPVTIDRADGARMTARANIWLELLPGVNQRRLNLVWEEQPRCK